MLHGHTDTLNALEQHLVVWGAVLSEQSRALTQSAPSQPLPWLLHPQDGSQVGHALCCTWGSELAGDVAFSAGVDAVSPHGGRAVLSLVSSASGQLCTLGSRLSSRLVPRAHGPQHTAETFVCVEFSIIKRWVFKYIFIVPMESHILLKTPKAIFQRYNWKERRRHRWRIDPERLRDDLRKSWCHMVDGRLERAMISGWLTLKCSYKNDSG